MNEVKTHDKALKEEDLIQQNHGVFRCLFVILFRSTCAIFKSIVSMRNLSSMKWEWRSMRNPSFLGFLCFLVLFLAGEQTLSPCGVWLEGGMNKQNFIVKLLKGVGTKMNWLKYPFGMYWWCKEALEKVIFCLLYCLQKLLWMGGPLDRSLITPLKFSDEYIKNLKISVSLRLTTNYYHSSTSSSCIGSGWHSFLELWRQ